MRAADAHQLFHFRHRTGMSERDLLFATVPVCDGRDFNEKAREIRRLDGMLHGESAEWLRNELTRLVYTLERTNLLTKKESATAFMEGEFRRELVEYESGDPAIVFAPSADTKADHTRIVSEVVKTALRRADSYNALDEAVGLTLHDKAEITGTGRWRPGTARGSAPSVTV